MILFGNDKVSFSCMCTCSNFMSCGFCIKCRSGAGSIAVSDLTLRWHGFYASCIDEDCSVCDCDCDHCCFGLGPACEDHPSIIKTCLFPSKPKPICITKADLNITRLELTYLNVLFELSQSPEKDNLVQMASIIAKFPHFEFLSDDSGTTVVDLIKTRSDYSYIADILGFATVCV